jgi:hypothetical protein
MPHSHKAKLTDREAALLRELYNERSAHFPELSANEVVDILADKFELHRRTVFKIIAFERYAPKALRELDRPEKAQRDLKANGSMPRGWAEFSGIEGQRLSRSPLDSFTDPEHS